MGQRYTGRQPEAAIIRSYRQHVSPGKADFFEAVGLDFVPGRREGAFIWSVDGTKRLIDCHSNGGVFNLGHRNPQIIEALIRSLEELDIGNHLLLSEQRARLAARLAELAPGSLPYTVFGVSGGEAVDLAIKIARAHTGRQMIVSMRGGYHGHTGLSLYTGDPGYFSPFGQRAAGFEQVPFGDVQVLEDALGAPVAAVILETVPATGGILVPEPDYLPAVRRLCDRNGALLIVDEVQTGLGRTGRFWAVDHFQVEPDILVIGKGLSGGIFPMTATSFRAELETVFSKDPFIHVSTLGGAEVGVPVAEMVLKISSRSDFLSHVSEIGALFAAGFDQLKTRHPHFLADFRQLGMMMGLETTGEFFGPLFSRAAFDNGLLCVYANNDRRVVQFLPPLIIDTALAGEIIDRLDGSFARMQEMVAWFRA